MQEEELVEIRGTDIKIETLIMEPEHVPSSIAGTAGGIRRACLICWKEIDGIDPSSEVEKGGAEKILTQIRDILGVAPSIYGEMDLKCLPLPLLCYSCYNTLMDAVVLQETIKSLQDRLLKLADIIKGDFVEGFQKAQKQKLQDSLDEVREVERIRRTYAQCWTNCEVRVKKTKVPSQRRVPKPTYIAEHSENENVPSPLVSFTGRATSDESDPEWSAAAAGDDLEPREDQIKVEAVKTPRPGPSIKRRREKHGQTPAKCHICERWFNRAAALKIHLQAKNPCSKGRFYPYRKNQHVPSPEEIARIEAKAKRMAVKKERVEEGAEGLVQKDGTAVTPRLVSLPKNTKKENEEEGNKSGFVCTICERPFKTKIRRAMHMLRHDNPDEVLKVCFSQVVQDGDKNLEAEVFECNRCNKKFPGEDSLNIDDQNQIICTHRRCPCKATFTDLGTFLLHHVKLCYAERRKQIKGRRLCEECGKEFANISTLNQHIHRVHPKPGSYICPHCGRLFGVRSVMNVHIERVHSTERKYQCHVCGSSFKTKDHLKTHVKINHSEVPPSYDCDLCGKTFKTKPHLQIHRANMHAGPEPQFPCQFCGKRFKSKFYVQNHISRMHKDQRDKKAKEPNAKKVLQSSDVEVEDGTMDFNISELIDL